MSARNTLLFGAALAVTTAAIGYDHATKPVPPRPTYDAGTAATGNAAAPCAAGAPTVSAAPCAAGAPKLAAPPPPAQRPAADSSEPAETLAAPPPAPKAKPAAGEAPDLADGV